MSAVLGTYGINTFFKDSKIVTVCHKYMEVTGEQFTGKKIKQWYIKFLIERYLSPESKIYKGLDQSLFKDVKRILPPSKTNQKKEYIYKKYISSLEWRIFSNKIKNERGNKCEECGSHREDVILHAHHLTYERFGNELPEDIQVLCVPCHEKKHPRKKKRR